MPSACPSSHSTICPSPQVIVISVLGAIASLSFADNTTRTNVINNQYEHGQKESSPARGFGIISTLYCNCPLRYGTNVKNTNRHKSSNPVFVSLVKCTRQSDVPESDVNISRTHSLAFSSIISFLSESSHSEAYFLKAPIKLPVLASCPSPLPGSSSSLRIFLARTLPSSTPHWSKELMSQMAPSVKVRCS